MLAVLPRRAPEYSIPFMVVERHGRSKGLLPFWQHRSPRALSIPVVHKTGGCLAPSLSPGTPCDDPDRMKDTWEVAEDRQQDVEPELPAEANGQEHANRWQEDREEDSEEIRHFKLDYM
jgi:hypothetical protein